MLKLTVSNSDGAVCAEMCGGESVSLLYHAAYCPGDMICLEGDCAAGCYAVIHLEDTLAPALIYLPGSVMTYRVPEEGERVVFSPKAFAGEKHLIRARLAEKEEIAARRNLAFNCYDRHGDNGCFPHSSANVGTRVRWCSLPTTPLTGCMKTPVTGNDPIRAGASTETPTPRCGWSLDALSNWMNCG